MPDLFKWKLATKDLDLEELEDKQFDFMMSNTKSEYIFVFDTSGSMDGTRIEKAKDALKFFLSSLPADSFFNVIFFNSYFYPAFQGSSVKLTQENLASVLQKIDQSHAGGGTEMYPAIEHAYTLENIPGYTKTIFVLTDGDIGNTNQVTSLVRSKSVHGYSSLYSIGIGSGASEFLVQEIAKSGKGKSVMISDEEDPKDKLGSLLAASLIPRLSNV